MSSLGHEVSGAEAKQSLAKVEVGEKPLMPNCLWAVQSIFGLTGYYRRYIRNYAKTADPLIDLTKKRYTFYIGCSAGGVL